MFNRMTYEFNNFSENDLRTVRWQMKAGDVSIGGVVERCAYGYPQIIFFHPTKMVQGEEQLDHEAMANLIWLTCPYLHRKIFALEHAGYIEKINGFIRSDPMLKSKMGNAQANFYFLRKNLYKSEGAGRVQEEKVFDTGIGGVTNLDSIKCLHLHYSHFRICEDNMAGYLTFNLLDKKINCDEVSCKNAS